MATRFETGFNAYRTSRPSDIPQNGSIRVLALAIIAMLTTLGFFDAARSITWEIAGEKYFAEVISSYNPFPDIIR